MTGRALAAGLAAGAAGTVALNTATYLDMLARGRPASSMPAEAAEKLSDLVGIDLGDDDTAPNRREALGALLGLATGLGVGASYGVLGSRIHVPKPVATIGLAALAMAASDLPMTALGLTDPRKWDATSWLSDLLPHLAYGTVATLVYELIADRTPSQAPPGRNTALPLTQHLSVTCP